MNLAGSHETPEMPLNLQEALGFAAELAQRAGTEVLKIRASGDLGIVRKSEEKSDLRSRGDLASRNIIIPALKEKYPDHSSREEEGMTHKGMTGYTWIVDPIDGTKNYTEGKPFSISIGLTYQGESIVGVLYFPDDDVTITAIKGQGAFRNGQRIEKRTDLRPLAEARLGFDVSAGGNETDELARFHDPFVGDVAEIKRLWCCTWGVRRMIENEGDGYVNGGGLTPYDLGALTVILREIGYLVEGIEGGDIDFGRDKIPVILVTHRELLEQIREVLAAA